MAAVAVIAAFMHALLFAVEQVDGFVDENRSAVVSWLETGTKQWMAERPRAKKPTVGLPLFTAKYDGVKSRIKEVPTLRLVGVRADGLEPKKAAPDFLVFSMPYFLRSLRQEAGAGGSFWKELGAEELGYRRVAEFQPRFRAEGIYSVLDPLQVHAWTNGDIGFFIYEKKGVADGR